MCSPMARETWVQSQVESYQRLKKWYLMPPGLTPSIIRYGSRVKWSNTGKGVAASPTPWYCSYRKGAFGSLSTKGRQLYFTYSNYITNHINSNHDTINFILLLTSEVESYQKLKEWYLMPPCSTFSIRWGSRVKWSNPGKGVALSPTLQCSSYWKGRLWITLD